MQYDSCRKNAMCDPLEPFEILYKDHCRGDWSLEGGREVTYVFIRSADSG